MQWSKHFHMFISFSRNSPEVGRLSSTGGGGRGGSIAPCRQPGTQVPSVLLLFLPHGYSIYMIPADSLTMFKWKKERQRRVKK